MKKLIAILMAALMLLGCANGICEETMTIIGMNGPTGMGLVYADDEQYAGRWSVQYVASAEEAKVAFVSGNADIVCLPTNLAAALYNKLPDDGVRLLGLNTLGVLYIVENGDAVQSLQDLNGKTLYVTGQGSTPEYVIRYILEKNGMTDQVTLEFVDDHDTLATMIASGICDLAMLPEPKVTAALMKNTDLRAALDVTELYNETARSNGEESVLSMGCVITTQKVIDEHPEGIRALIDAYGISVENVNGSVSKSAERMAEKGIIPKAQIAMQAIPRCHIVFITGTEMKELIRPFFEMLYESDPRAVGGALPGDDLYYIP